jgi:hypothetical protein
LAEGLMRPRLVELVAEGGEATLLGHVAAGGRVVSPLRVRCIRSWRGFCSG